MNTEQRPRVGVGILIRRDGKVLLGKRRGSHGAGQWCPPGGHLEFMETIERCVRREAREEAGVEFGPVIAKVTTEDFFEADGRHYISVTSIADWHAGEPQIFEPEKFEAWEWFPWDALPEPIFVPIENLRREGFDPFSV